MDFLKKLITLILLVFLFASCEKEDFNSIDSQKVEVVKNLKGESQKIAFSMLSKEGKYYIWKERLNSLKSSNYLNSAQKQYVQELLNSLKVEYFEGNASQKHVKYYETYLPEMKRIGKILFTQDQIISYFSSLNDIDNTNISQKLPGDGGSSNCNCSSSDDWCVWGSSCFAWSCGRSVNCGWWLQETCNGLCVSN